MKILVTGSAGFIGFHLVKKLLDSKNTIIGVDSINNYYDQKLKKDRLKILKSKASNEKKNTISLKLIYQIKKKQKKFLNNLNQIL